MGRRGVQPRPAAAAAAAAAAAVPAGAASHWRGDCASPRLAASRQANLAQQGEGGLQRACRHQQPRGRPGPPLRRRHVPRPALHRRRSLRAPAQDGRRTRGQECMRGSVGGWAGRKACEESAPLLHALRQRPGQAPRPAKAAGVAPEGVGGEGGGVAPQARVLQQRRSICVLACTPAQTGVPPSKTSATSPKTR